MVNPDIVGGLKSAITRGYSLDEAMLSFLNAGYKKAEIEEASQSLQSQIASGAVASELPPQPVLGAKQNESKVVKQTVPPQQFQPAPPKQVVTKGVAAYTNFDTTRIKTITIVLAILLVVLIGILGLMYLFKNQIIDFFNSLF